MDVDDDRRARGGDGDLQPVRRWGGRPAAAEIVQQRVADFDCEPRLVATLRRFDLHDIHGAELIAQHRTSHRGLLAIERLEAAAGAGGEPHRCGGRRTPALRRLAKLSVFRAEWGRAGARPPAPKPAPGGTARRDPRACHATTLTILCGTTITFLDA